MTKLGLVENEQLQKKLNEIEKCTDTPVMISGLTGYTDYREMSTALFQILALLEIEGEERSNMDAFILKKFQKEKEDLVEHQKT